MKINLQSVKQLAIFGMASLVISCGGGDGAVPVKAKPVPKGTISGVILMGAVRDAEITVYGFDPKSQLVNEKDPVKVISSRESTDSEGRFSFELQLPAKITPLLICTTAGTYNEPAAPLNSDNAVKSFGPTDKLCTAIEYEKGVSQEISITHYTHLATGLLKHKLAHGGKLLTSFKKSSDPQKEDTIVLGSIQQANYEIGLWLGFDIVSTIPVDFANADNASASNLRSPEVKYGLAIISISSLVDWLSTEGAQEGLFKNASSLGYAQKMYEDIKSDAKLNGKAGSASIRYAGNNLGLHITRHHYALRILSVITNQELNHTALTLSDVRAFVETISQYDGSIFPSAAIPDPLNLDKVAWGHPATELHDLTKILTDERKIQITAVHAAGIATIRLSMVPEGSTTNIGVPSYNKVAHDPQTGTNTSLYTWTMNTNDIPDGRYVGLIEASTNLDSTKFEPYEYKNLRVLNKGVGVVVIPLIAPEALNPDNAISVDPSNLSTKNRKFVATVTDGFAGTIVNFRLLDGQGNAVPNVTLTATGPTTGAGGAIEYSAVLDISNIPDNLYVFEAEVISGAVPTGTTPAADLTAIETYKFAVDKIKPTATISSPVNFNPNTGIGAYNTPPQFKVVLDDPKNTSTNYASGIGIVSITTENAVTYPGDFYGVKSVNEPLNGLSEGPHELLIELIDIAGNHNHSALIKYVFDSKLPIIQEGRSRVNTWNKALPLSATATDEVGLKTFTYQTETIASTRITINDPLTQAVSGTVPVTASGVFIITYDATDIAGNNAVQRIAGPIGVDIKAPILTAAKIVLPTPSSTLQFKAVDAAGKVNVATGQNVEYTVEATIEEPGFKGSVAPPATDSGVDTKTNGTLGGASIAPVTTGLTTLATATMTTPVTNTLYTSVASTQLPLSKVPADFYKEDVRKVTVSCLTTHTLINFSTDPSPALINLRCVRNATTTQTNIPTCPAPYNGATTATVDCTQTLPNVVYAKPATNVDKYFKTADGTTATTAADVTVTKTLPISAYDLAEPKPGNKLSSSVCTNLTITNTTPVADVSIVTSPALTASIVEIYSAVTTPTSVTVYDITAVSQFSAEKAQTDKRANSSVPNDGTTALTQQCKTLLVSCTAATAAGLGATCNAPRSISGTGICKIYSKAVNLKTYNKSQNFKITPKAAPVTSAGC